MPKEMVMRWPSPTLACGREQVRDEDVKWVGGASGALT